MKYIFSKYNIKWNNNTIDQMSFNNIIERDLWVNKNLFDEGENYKDIIENVVSTTNFSSLDPLENNIELEVYRNSNNSNCVIIKDNDNNITFHYIKSSRVQQNNGMGDYELEKILFLSNVNVLESMNNIELLEGHTNIDNLADNQYENGDFSVKEKLIIKPNTEIGLEQVDKPFIFVLKQLSGVEKPFILNGIEQTYKIYLAPLEDILSPGGDFRNDFSDFLIRNNNFSFEIPNTNNILINKPFKLRVANDHLNNQYRTYETPHLKQLNNKGFQLLTPDNEINKIIAEEGFYNKSLDDSMRFKTVAIKINPTTGNLIVYDPSKVETLEQIEDIELSGSYGNCNPTFGCIPGGTITFSFKDSTNFNTLYDFFYTIEADKWVDQRLLYCNYFVINKNGSVIWTKDNLIKYYNSNSGTQNSLLFPLKIFDINYLDFQLKDLPIVQIEDFENISKETIDVEGEMLDIYVLDYVNFNNTIIQNNTYTITLNDIDIEKLKGMERVKIGIENNYFIDIPYNAIIENTISFTHLINPSPNEAEERIIFNYDNSFKHLNKENNIFINTKEGALSINKLQQYKDNNPLNAFEFFKPISNPLNFLKPANAISSVAQLGGEVINRQRLKLSPNESKGSGNIYGDLIFNDYSLNFLRVTIEYLGSSWLSNFNNILKRGGLYNDFILYDFKIWKNDTFNYLRFNNFREANETYNLKEEEIVKYEEIFSRGIRIWNDRDNFKNYDIINRGIR